MKASAEARCKVYGFREGMDIERQSLGGLLDIESRCAMSMAGRRTGECDGKCMRQEDEWRFLAEVRG
jgi:hypothetical protein